MKLRAVSRCMCRMQVIKKHPNAHQKYVDKLLQEGVVTEDEVREVHNRIQGIMQEEFEMAKEHRVSEQEWLSSVWSGFNSPSQRSRIRNTGMLLLLVVSTHTFWCWTVPVD